MMTSNMTLLIFFLAVLFGEGWMAIIASRVRQTSLYGGEAQGSTAEGGEICSTEGCTLAAKTILDYMDDTVDPCDNFYKFACGGFEAKHVIPDDRPSISGFDLVRDELNKRLQKLIEEPIQDSEPKPFKMAKNMFQSCINTELIEKQGLEPLKKLLTFFGGWPVVEGDTWKEADFSWINSVYQFREKGFPINYFAEFRVIPDLKNTSNNILNFDQPIFGIKLELLRQGLDSPIVKAYLQYQIDLAKLLGADPSKAEKEAKEALEFEMELGKIALLETERRNFNKIYNPYYIKDLLKQWPSIPWLEYANKLLPSSVQLTEDELVLVFVPSYFENFQKLMESTPKRVQANYHMWRAAQYSVERLNDDAKKLETAFNAVMRGTAAREARWKECVAAVGPGTGLSLAFSALYVRNYFKESARLDATEMVANIKANLISNLDFLDWIDPDTRERAKSKGNKLHTHIAYPVELLDDATLGDYYNRLELNNEDFLLNALSLNKFSLEYTLEQLRKPVNKTEWTKHGTSATVNAFYYPLENSIEFTAGILQGVFFNNERPRYMNYGGIGTVIGHEISHGLDDMGSQFDENGNLANWWNDKTKQAYVERTKCIVEQYGNFTLADTELHLNGLLVQGEAVADNTGIKQANQAYHTWVSKNQPEPGLPGLEKYTPNQLFWISVGNVWCNKARMEVLKSRIVTLAHPPSEFRVIGALSNLEQFSNDFNCAKGTKMNPEKKCTVW